MSGPSIRRAPASTLLRLLSGLLTLSILVQFFIAGMSSITNPHWWEYHKIWVGIFQWLVLPLPIFAWLCGKPRSGRLLLASLPVLQIALQYILVHRGLDGRLPIGVGLHAVNAALMLIVATILTLGWHDGKTLLEHWEI
jgi:Family of unknown function (DUF6220)